MKKHFVFLMIVVTVFLMACQGSQMWPTGPGPVIGDKNETVQDSLIPGPTLPSDGILKITINGNDGGLLKVMAGEGRIATQMLYDGTSDINRWIDLPTPLKIDDEDWSYASTVQVLNSDGDWVNTTDLTIGDKQLPGEAVDVDGVWYIRPNIAFNRIDFVKVSNGYVNEPVKFRTANVPAEAVRVEILGTFTNALGHGWQRYEMLPAGGGEFATELWIIAGEHDYNVVAYNSDGVEVAWPCFGVYANGKETHKGVENGSERKMQFSINKDGEVTIFGKKDFQPDSTVDNIKFECKDAGGADSAFVCFKDGSTYKMKRASGGDRFYVYLDNIKVYTTSNQYANKYKITLAKNGDWRIRVTKCYVEGTETNRGQRYDDNGDGENDDAYMFFYITDQKFVSPLGPEDFSAGLEIEMPNPNP